MCEFLVGALVVGAMEVTPGWMTVDYINRRDLGYPDKIPQVERIQIPIQHYLDCYDNE